MRSLLHRVPLPSLVTHTNLIGPVKDRNERYGRVVTGTSICDEVGGRGLQRLLRFRVSPT